MGTNSEIWINSTHMGNEIILGTWVHGYIFQNLAQSNPEEQWNFFGYMGTNLLKREPLNFEAWSKLCWVLGTWVQISSTTQTFAPMYPAPTSMLTTQILTENSTQTFVPMYSVPAAILMTQGLSDNLIKTFVPMYPVPIMILTTQISKDNSTQTFLLMYLVPTTILATQSLINSWLKLLYPCTQYPNQYQQPKAWLASQLSLLYPCTHSSFNERNMNWKFDPDLYTHVPSIQRNIDDP